MSQVFLSGAWNEFSPGRMLSICFKAVAVSWRAKETLSLSVGAGTRDQTTKILSTFQCGVSGISVYQTSGARKVRGLRRARCRPGGALTTAPPISSPPSASSHRRRCALAPAREPRSAGSKRSRRAGVSVSGANFRRCEVAGRLGAMSGDGSGRRSEGRGRGRDQHRDRTCSRSRSRSPLSPVSRRGAAPERREAPERPSLEETEPSDSGDEMMDPASLEAETDHGLCRQIRHQYRALINSVQRKAGRRGRGRGAARALGGAGGGRGQPCAAWPRLDWLARRSHIRRADIAARPWPGRAGPRGAGRHRRRPGAGGRSCEPRWSGRGRDGTRSLGSFSCIQRFPASARPPAAASPVNCQKFKFPDRTPDLSSLKL